MSEEAPIHAAASLWLCDQGAQLVIEPGNFWKTGRGTADEPVTLTKNIHQIQRGSYVDSSLLK